MLTRFCSRRAVLAGVIGFTAASGRAEAHAVLEASEPVAGATIAAGMVALKLSFNSRIDRARSGLTLTQPDGTRTNLKIDPDGPPNILTTTADLTQGAYVLHWQVLAIDGHITRGDVRFTVSGN